jgi:hypothetical protein
LIVTGKFKDESEHYDDNEYNEIGRLSDEEMDYPDVGFTDRVRKNAVIGNNAYDDDFLTSGRP